MAPRPTHHLVDSRSRVQRRLLILSCWLGFAVLPVAHTIATTSAREASAPVEESPIGFSETALVRRVESRQPSLEGLKRSPGRPGDSQLSGSRVSRCRTLPGHRLANGLLAPLRT
jgi:hypothetical protein